MNQNTIIGLVVAIVVVGGGAWYMSSHSDNNMNGQETAGEQGQSTFAALAAMGGSRTCHITVNTDGNASEGTVYIADGRMRGDFTSTVNGKAMTAHMLQADGYMYSWTDAMAQGVKVSLAQAQQANTQSQGINPNANVTYDCSAGVGAGASFDVPSNVSFMELGATGGASAGGAAGATMPAGMPVDIPTDQLPYH